MRRLALTVSEFSGPLEWEWRLTEAGRELGRHEVRIPDGEWQYAAFADLFGHIGWRTTPAGWQRVEPAVARQLGMWAAERLLGDLAAHLEGPATVEVLLPGQAAPLGFLPLEAIVVGNRSLALSRVTFTFHVCADGAHPVPLAKRSPAHRLRILAIFSLPSGTTALALRRERLALTRLVDRIDADIELLVLQYGTTRETFRQACAQLPGWDIVHISGHGEATGIMLETSDSRPDPVSAQDLVRLMLPLRESVSLVTLSSCESAAAAGDASLARDVARRLDCSVMAMRFPVSDQFAADLMLGVYDKMICGRQELPAALGVTLERLRRERAQEPQLSFSTPAIFGCRAASATAFTTRQAAPEGQQAAEIPVPERFVGRVDLLARARRAITPESTVPGVIFQGMTGVGKTACARELVSVSAGAFDIVVWHSVPPTMPDPDAALVGFAETLDEQFPGLGLRAAISDASFGVVMSALADLCRRARVLTVIDDAEMLLDAQGRWRTAGWQAVIAALTPDGAASRLVVTSRVSVVGGCEPCIVQPLSRDESLLLVRELPQLGELLAQRSPAWLRLIRRVLDIAQGHPAVLEIADAQVQPDHPERLQTVLDSMDAGATSYPQVLVEWAERVLLPIPQEQRLFFRFMCCLEEQDRQDLLTGAGPVDWSLAWYGIGGTVPIEELLAPLLAAGLISRARGTPAIHPAVVSHLCEQDPEFVADVTEKVAGLWGGMFVSSLPAEAAAEAAARLAAWRGLPYAARAQDAFRLQFFVHHILLEDHSHATAVVLRSVLAPAAAWNPGPFASAELGEISRRVFGYLLAKIGRDLAPDSEEAMRAVIADALAACDPSTANAMRAELFEYLYRRGDLDGAEAEAEAMLELPEEEGSLPGQVSQITAERFRIDVLNRRGRYPEALAAGTTLLRALDNLADEDDTDYLGARLQVSLQRQHLLAALSSAAGGMGQWKSALEFHRAHLEEQHRQGASRTAIASTIYNTYIPLMRLGRLKEAAAAVATAREEFERAGAQDRLGMALSAQGEIEIKRGNHELALDLVGEGLRHTYRQPVTSTIAIMHSIYGTTAFNTGRLDVAVAHLAAAAALQLRMGDVRATENLAMLDIALRAGGTFTGDEAAAKTIDRTTGTGFQALASQTGLAAGALADACELARRRGGALPAHLLAIWDPIFSALAAAARGDTEAHAALIHALAIQATNPDWERLVDNIRSLLDPTTGTPPGGDEIDVALFQRAQTVWAGEAVVRPGLWRAIEVRELIADVVLGALGDGAGKNRAMAVIDDPRLADMPLSVRFRRLLAGDRDQEALLQGLDPVTAEVLETVLDYVR